MAVQATLVNTSLSIMYKNGIDANGKDIIKSKKYSNLKTTAASDDLLFVGTSIGSLMKYELAEVQRSDESTLVNA